jgi:hypothetical protein
VPSITPARSGRMASPIVQLIVFPAAMSAFVPVPP